MTDVGFEPTPPDFAPADLTTRLYGGRNTHAMGLRPLYIFLILSARGPCLEVRKNLASIDVRF